MRLDKNRKIRTNSEKKLLKILPRGLVFIVMVHDIHSSDTPPEPDSLGDDYISYSDWQSPSGAMIEARIDRNTWPDALLSSFQHTAPKTFDDILAAHDSAPASVSLCLCNDLQMRQINLQHRQVDKVTNVLSFPAYDMPSHQFDTGVPALLGDIVIAAETMSREAESLRIPASDHLMHLFVHGMLHLFGYDHIDDDMAETMESLETKFLSNIGIANPYQDTQLEVDN